MVKTHTHTNECPVAKTAGTEEYTDCFSAEGMKPSTNESPVAQSSGDSRIHRLLLFRWVWPTHQRVACSLVGWGYRIHRLLLFMWLRPPTNECPVAQLTGAIEYTDCFSVNWLNSHNEHHKQSDGEVPVMLELWWNAEYPFTSIAPRSTLARSGSIR